MRPAPSSADCVATANGAAGPAMQAEQQAALACACRALWLATLSLMTAYSRTQAPAHRLQLATRICRNFGTLQREAPAFAPRAGDHFGALARRWQVIMHSHLYVRSAAPHASRQTAWRDRLAQLLGLS